MRVPLDLSDVATVLPIHLRADSQAAVSRYLDPRRTSASATPHLSMASSIRTFQEDLGERAMPGYVVHTGDIRLPLGPKPAARSGRIRAHSPSLPILMYTDP